MRRWTGLELMLADHVGTESAVADEVFEESGVAEVLATT